MPTCRSQDGFPDWDGLRGNRFFCDYGVCLRLRFFFFSYYNSVLLQVLLLIVRRLRLPLLPSSVRSLRASRRLETSRLDF